MVLQKLNISMESEKNFETARTTQSRSGKDRIIDALLLLSDLEVNFVILMMMVIIVIIINIYCCSETVCPDVVYR